MYKIPEEVDITKFKNQTLSQLTFGLNYILLTFNNFSIQFSGQFYFRFDGKDYEKEEVYPVYSDYGLLNLLEKKIEAIYCNEERSSLTIEFGENSFLTLKSSEMYESFELNIEGKRVIVQIAAKGGKELFKFGGSAGRHMAEPGRAVPVQILEQAIKGSKGVADPKGSRALMHSVEMFRNGKPYKLDVLYDKATNTIWHFQYSPIKP